MLEVFWPDKGGVLAEASTCQQMQTNVDKRKRTQRWQRKPMEANMSECGQTQTNSEKD